MLVSMENTNVYIAYPDVMSVMQPGQRLGIQPGLQHMRSRDIPRRCLWIYPNTSIP